jgi:hypothetical protein
VTARTNKDNPKIDFAGVYAGAKIFVGLQGCAVSAKAAAAPQIKTITSDIRTRQLIEPLDRNWTPCCNGQNEQHARPLRNWFASSAGSETKLNQPFH